MSTTLFRYFPRDAIRTATIRHVGTTAGKKSYSTTDDETAVGALVQLSRYQRALMADGLKVKYLFFVDDDADIRESDLVTIDSVNYKVMNVDLYDYGTTKHRAATLTTP